MCRLRASFHHAFSHSSLSFFSQVVLAEVAAGLGVDIEDIDLAGLAFFQGSEFLIENGFDRGAASLMGVLRDTSGLCFDTAARRACACARACRLRADVFRCAYYLPVCAFAAPRNTSSQCIQPVATRTTGHNVTPRGALQVLRYPRTEATVDGAPNWRWTFYIPCTSILVTCVYMFFARRTACTEAKTTHKRTR